MCAPWLANPNGATGVDRFRGPIEQFAETVISKVR